MKRLWEWAIKHRTCWELPIYLSIGVGGFIGFFWEKLWMMDQDAVRNLILLVAGIVGWYFLYWRTKVAREDATTAKQSLLVDQFTHAIDQLASGNPSIRLGGIHNLEQIALSHEDEREKITQILSARLRELAPVDDAITEIQTENKRMDIKAIVLVLIKITQLLLKSNKRHINVLKDTDLSGLTFYNIDFSNFIFGAAKLR